jgi:hypothetical protein
VARRFIGTILGLLAWPALFGALGWNFLDYGLDASGDNNTGGSAGWIICAVVFGLMAIVPLLIGWKAALIGDVPRFGRGDKPSSSGELAGDLIDRFERLAALHRRRQITDAEYAAAKQALLEGR